jgi:ketosteroid isomerase-like protein
VKIVTPSRLAALVTDDVVAVYHNGRCTSGKNEFKTFFLHAFRRGDIEGMVSSSEVMVHDKWAMVDEVKGTRAPLVGAGAPIHTHFRAVFVFARQSDASGRSLASSSS